MWISDNSSDSYHVACEGGLVGPVPDYVAKLGDSLFLSFAGLEHDKVIKAK